MNSKTNAAKMTGILFISATCAAIVSGIFQSVSFEGNLQEHYDRDRIDQLGRL